MRSIPTFLAVLIFGAIVTAFPQLHADIVVDSGSFASEQPSGGGFVVATSQFSLDGADIPHICFDANFDIIDAGIEVLVNGISLFSTGDDVSNFGPQVFQPTADQPDNIDFSFSPNDNGLPRLSVHSDSTGTSFSGSAFQTSTTVVDFFPLFSVADFESLLQAGNNVIEIVNLNGFQGANLVGDYTVTLKEEVTAVPEPASLLGLLALAGAMSLRRRRN